MDWNEATTPPSQPSPTPAARPRGMTANGKRLGPAPIFADPERERKFFEAIELFSGDISKSAKAIGINKDTVYSHANRCPIFKSKLQQASVLFELNCLRTISASIKGEGEEGKGKSKNKKEWRAAAWLLERRVWEAYGRRDPNAVTPEMLFSAGNGISEILLKFVPAEQRKAAAEEIQARMDELLKSAKVSNEDEDPFLDSR